jgi:hypothetical protein
MQILLYHRKPHGVVIAGTDEAMAEEYIPEPTAKVNSPQVTASMQSDLLSEPSNGDDKIDALDCEADLTIPHIFGR